MKKLVIDVKCWGRYDYYNNGKLCAVGFLARQNIRQSGLKATEENIENEAKNISLKNEDAITTANDNLKGKIRRDTLRNLFKKEGYQLVFKNLG